MRSNCVAFALKLHARRKRAGREGYILLRWSRWGPFPHMLYGERRVDGSIRVVSYKPLGPRPRACPPPMFRGESKWGDL